MQTSQTKKGNPQHKSRDVLRKERERADRERREEAGLPIGDPVLPECPHCAQQDTPVVLGITRVRVRMSITDCCRGVIVRDHMRNAYFPRKKRPKQ